jgi:hypothetical protein
VQIASLNVTAKNLAGHLLLLCALATATAQAQSVAVRCPQPTPQCAYAARKLSAALAERGLALRSEHSDPERRVVLAVSQDHLKPEEFSIDPKAGVITITGGDNRGMIYGALALA